MSTVADELRRWVAAARGALLWHLETGDADLPVPPGFRPPPLGAIAAAPAGQRGGGAGAREARGGLQRLSAALDGAAPGVSGVTAAGGSGAVRGPGAGQSGPSSVSRVAETAPLGVAGAAAPSGFGAAAPSGFGATPAPDAAVVPGGASPFSAPAEVPFSAPAAAPAAFDPRGLDERAAASAALRVLRDTIGDCRRCSLSQGRTELVFGFGDPRARVMFVADQPGSAEDEVGLPFSDDGGRLLGRMIRAMGLTRADVWLTYLVNCYDRDQQRPEPGLDACEPFLAREIEIVQPEVIIALGQLPALRLTGAQGQIPHLRGRWHPCRLGGRETPVMVTFAPVALIQNPDIKRPVWADLKQVMRKLGLPAPAR